MMTQIPQKPPCFDYLDGLHDYYELKNNKGIYGHMALLFIMGECAIHLDIFRWSVSVRKDAVASMPQLIKAAKDNGCKRLVVMNSDSEDKRLAKMLKMFGFEKPQLMQIFYRRI